MGLVINQRADHIHLPDLLVQLHVVSAEEASHLPRKALDVPVLRGGPVDTGRGFVLHSADYTVPHATVHLADDICLTASLDVLHALADGKGPRQAVLALGYAGWGRGQLEAEVQANAWLQVPVNSDILFAPDPDTQYRLALELIGVNPVMLSVDVGHA
jgi:putative transcriptional regulator